MVKQGEGEEGRGRVCGIFSRYQVKLGAPCLGGLSRENKGEGGSISPTMKVFPLKVSRN